MVSIRLQHLQWGGALAAAIGCLALGAMSLLASLDDYRRVKAGAEAFQRFEIVSDAVNAMVAERAPANVLIASGTNEQDKAEPVRRSRAETDRLLALMEQSLLRSEPRSSAARSKMADVLTHLRFGRELIDEFVSTPADQRRSQDFRAAAEAMFAAASAGEALRDLFGQQVIAVAPEVSVEVFLGFAVGSLRDQAGRLGSYVVSAQREMGADPATLGKLQATAGRLHAGNRILRTLVQALPDGQAVVARLGDVERQFFHSALPFSLATAARAGTDKAISTAEFAAVYVRGLALIDGLREAIVASSQVRLDRIGAAAFNRAALAASLTALVCLILLGIIVIFRRALFAPLDRAQAQAIAIARGDLSEPANSGRVGGEVGEMLAGLDAIRDEQRWRRELEEQQIEMARQLKRLADTDTLTGLLNRRAIQALASRTLGEADWAHERIGLILFDIDHFKSINDTFGHGVGDEVLRAIANEMAALLRPQDAFARFGGEEFLVLLPGVTAEEARGLADTLRDRLPVLVGVPDGDRRVTASFGLALREPGSRASWDELVTIADRRLYAAKKGGRDRVCDSGDGISIAA